MITKINLSEKFSLIHETWHPKILGELNDSYIKAAKLEGEFIWHKHDHEDELFLVVKGRLTIRLHEGDVTLEEGEFVIIPKGVEHCPIADEEVQVLLLEPKTTINTGDTASDRTVNPEWI